MSERTKESKTQKPVRLLVTGASGFLGSAIAEQCRMDGMEVIATGRRELKIGVPGYFTADVTDPKSMSGALTNVDCVIHAAGLAHQFRDGKKSSPFLKINVNGTENVALAATRAGVSHFVLISSVSVYGPHGKQACDEETICNSPEPYGQSKYQAEQRAREIIEKAGGQLTILRLATVYGEGDPGNVGRLMRMIDRGRFVWVGDGSNRKSLIHKNDAARACTHVVRQPSPGINTYNVTASISTMRAIVEELASALGRELPRWRIPPGVAKTMAISFDRIARRGKRSGKFARTVERWLDDDVYDASRFNREFGFAAKVLLSDGLRREVKWYRQSVER